MSALNNSALIGASGSTGYLISRSVRLRSSASAYFNRTMAAGSAVTVYTFSAWVKRGELGTIKPIVQGYLNNNNYGHIIFKADNTIEWREVSVAANYGQVNTNAVFRDPSAWYHIVVVRNGTSLLIYVNGVSQTLTVSTAVNAAGGYLFGASTAQRIGSDQVNSAFFDGYLTECYLIDGQALTPASFGETNPITGVWQPKKYAGTYGTNGFYLNFSDNSGVTATTIGKDYSGNGNNWTPNNISVTAGVTYDSMLDVPTQWADGGNGRGNYATLNPLRTGSSFIKNGNLSIVDINTGSISIYGSMYSTNWYAEVTVASLTGVGLTYIGVELENGNLYGYVSDGTKQSPGVNAAYSGNSYTTGDVIGITYSTAGEITFYKNGVSQGSAFTGLSGSGTVFLSSGSSTARTYHANFGQRPFAYTPPTGFKALNTLNLPTPTILKGNQYFDATTYTGNGSTQSIVNAGGFQPDLVWTKMRGLSAGHNLVDAVRGATKALYSNLTNAETTDTNGVTAFNANGFALGSASGYNNNGVAAVGWQWKEGATQGFDIVTYTGTGANRTVAHSLGVAPSMMIFKPRNAADNWPVWHKSFAVNEYVYLNLTNAKASLSTFMNSTLPNSSDITLGTWANTNANTQTMVCYAFSEVAGFSKFGSYTGNGSADGPMIFTGFLPRWVLIKCSSAAGTGWYVYDTVRNTYNVMDLYLRPDVSDAETTFTAIDCLSNGFKLRTSNSQFNGSGSTYVYAAFASSPFKNSLAR